MLADNRRLQKYMQDQHRNGTAIYSDQEWPAGNARHDHHHRHAGRRICDRRPQIRSRHRKLQGYGLARQGTPAAAV